MKKLLNKKVNKKGFTLAELLIVVAIIAVLVAIAIPIFTKQLEKSRDATSVANMRSAYAEAQTAMVSGEASSETNMVYNITNGAGTIVVKNVNIKSHIEDSWSGQAADLPFTAPKDTGLNAKTNMTFTYEDDALTEVSF